MPQGGTCATCLTVIGLRHFAGAPQLDAAGSVAAAPENPCQRNNLGGGALFRERLRGAYE